jgi:hypothetical protein
MNSETSSPRFDPAADDVVLRLLWRDHLDTEVGARGPRRRLSVDQIIDAAIELADTGGIDALSMRKVAESVGVSVMSLYGYVPHRSGLIGLMVDKVIGLSPMPVHSGSVAERVRCISEVLWDEYHRHPWLVDAQSHRPWIGPHTSARYEWGTRSIRRLRTRRHHHGPHSRTHRIACRGQRCEEHQRAETRTQFRRQRPGLVGGQRPTARTGDACGIIPRIKPSRVGGGGRSIRR